VEAAVAEAAADGRELAAAPGPVRVTLEVRDVTPKPRSLELTRVNNSGSTTLPTQLYDILKSCQLARPGYHTTRSV